MSDMVRMEGGSFNDIPITATEGEFTSKRSTFLQRQNDDYVDFVTVRDESFGLRVIWEDET
jgi:hypothetical protein